MEGARILSEKASKEDPQSLKSRLSALLRDRFGLKEFRPGQEPVCATLAQGQDVLLVMPTGAGKSLCYQLPGIARGATTLVISPLLALIEDQVGSLKRAGFKAERIHSGCTRDASREVCRQYLAGELDFLFIAPERLAVPGFPQLLARRPLGLIAIDEAHCISQWGHDFRPDYRLLGERLTALRPAPAIALTATATPIVQKDICAQLGFKDEARFVLGFRRSNIGILAHELPPAERPDAIAAILGDRARVPAIVYAPTRKKADEIAGFLAPKLKCKSYHAGMGADAREAVQSAFLDGHIDVIVATVAFGMGIDKPNVRTVIHAAVPGSVEGYYQEIGRAGRDGLPSTAVLLHSYADQRTHEFFLDVNYPEPDELAKVYAQLKLTPISKEGLRSSLGRMEDEAFERCLEQLWVHRGALMDPEENVIRGDMAWKKAYVAQRTQKQAQLQKMLEFAGATRCRMRMLVSHFGDQNDSGIDCGACDRCDASLFADYLPSRGLSQSEIGTVKQILAILEGEGAVAAGRLFSGVTEAYPRLARGQFEQLINLLASEKWLDVIQESFEKDGKQIPYRKLRLTSLGRSAQAEDISALSTHAQSAGSAPKRRERAKTIRRSSPSSETPRGFETLRAWRLEKARARGVPAFRIMSDRVLIAICERSPRSPEDLLEVSGFSQKALASFGDEILKALGESLGRL